MNNSEHQLAQAKAEAEKSIPLAPEHTGYRVPLEDVQRVRRQDFIDGAMWMLSHYPSGNTDALMEEIKKLPRWAYYSGWGGIVQDEDGCLLDRNEVIALLTIYTKDR